MGYAVDAEASLGIFTQKALKAKTELKTRTDLKDVFAKSQTRFNRGMFVEQLNLTLAIPEIALAIFALFFLLLDSLTKGRFLSVLHLLVIVFCSGLGALS